MLCLWRGRLRLVGAPLACIAFALWAATPRPPVLVAESGKLIGLMTDEGRALSKPRGDGFSADSWLENDGDAATRQTASARDGYQVDGKLRWLTLGDDRILHATGKEASANALDHCAEVALVIVDVALATAADGTPCQVYDARRLRRSGSLAISPGPGGLVVTEAAAQDRPWSGGGPRQ
jgi:competence protein ComEC